MSANRPIFRRRQFLIKRELQFRYIRVVFILVLFASLVTGYTVFTTAWSFLGEKLADVYPQGRFLHVIRATNIALIRNLLIISPLIFFLALLYSHKIAGPIYRIGKSLDEISHGNLALRIRLRKGDELVDIADKINAVTENFSATLSTDKDIMAKLKGELTQLKACLPGGIPERTRLDSLTAEMESNINGLEAALKKWNV